MDAELVLWADWWVALSVRANWPVLSGLTSFAGTLQRVDEEDRAEADRLARRRRSVFGS